MELIFVSYLDMMSEISSKQNDTTTDVADSIFKQCDESIDFHCKSERTFCVPKYWLCDGVVSKEFFRTCNVLPFSCTHLALWRGKEQGKRPKVHAKQKRFKNFFSGKFLKGNNFLC